MLCVAASQIPNSYLAIAVRSSVTYDFLSFGLDKRHDQDLSDFDLASRRSYETLVPKEIRACHELSVTLSSVTSAS